MDDRSKPLKQGFSVSDTLKGIKRNLGTAPYQKEVATVDNILVKMVDSPFPWPEPGTGRFCSWDLQVHSGGASMPG